MDGEDFKSTLNHFEDYLVGVTLTIGGILALGLNASVLAIAIKHWKKIKVLETYTICLAIADICMAIVLFPMVITSSFLHGWVFGTIGCQCYAYVGFVYGIFSITILATFSVLRCIKICGSHSGIDISSKTISLTILVSLAFAFIWASFPFFGWGAYDFETTRLSCTLNWEARVETSYISAAFAVALVIPMLVMCVAYGKIIYFIQKRQTLQTTRITGKKPAKLAISVCLGFLVAWLPYGVVSMWAAYGDPSQIPIGVTVIPVTFSKLSTVYNPIIYFFHSKTYREQFKDDIVQCFRKRFLGKRVLPTTIVFSVETQEDSKTQGFDNQNRSATTKSGTDTLNEFPTYKILIPRGPVMEQC